MTGAHDVLALIVVVALIAALALTAYDWRGPWV